MSLMKQEEVLEKGLSELKVSGKADTKQEEISQ